MKKNLKKGLSEAATFLLSNVLLRNSGDPRFQGIGYGNQNPFNTWEFGPVLEAPTDADTTAAPPPLAKAPDPVGDDVDSYGTNLQEAGVQEGDRLVSDGDFGKSLHNIKDLVWWNYFTHIALLFQLKSVCCLRRILAGMESNDGEIVTQIQMPTFEEMQQEITTRKLSIAYYWNPSPEIVSLLLHEDRLLVIVQGYGHLWSEKYTQSSNTSSYPILYDYQATHGRVYSTSSLVVSANNDKKPTLDLVGTFDISGVFKGVRAIDGNAHIVTTSGVDTYTDLVGPFERWNYGENISTEQYMERAKSLARRSKSRTSWTELWNNSKSQQDVCPS